MCTYFSRVALGAGRMVHCDGAVILQLDFD